MSNAAGNIMQILANLPVFLRKPMLLNRLKEFYAMSDNDKRETINMALSAAPTIDPNKLSALFRTWLEILSEFDTEKRAIMFQTYCKQILEILTAVVVNLIGDSLQEVLFSFPNRYEILKQVPEDSLKAVGLK